MISSPSGKSGSSRTTRDKTGLTEKAAAAPVLVLPVNGESTSVSTVVTDNAGSLNGSVESSTLGSVGATGKPSVAGDESDDNDDHVLVGVSLVDVNVVDSSAVAATTPAAGAGGWLVNVGSVKMRLPR